MVSKKKKRSIQVKKVRKKTQKPKLANCSPQKVFNALKKIGDFFVKKSGGKHTKITHLPTGKTSVIPRHNPIDRNLLKDFVEDYLVKELGYSEEEIYKYLWC